MQAGRECEHSISPKTQPHATNPWKEEEEDKTVRDKKERADGYVIHYCSRCSFGPSFSYYGRIYLMMQCICLHRQIVCMNLHMRIDCMNIIQQCNMHVFTHSRLFMYACKALYLRIQGLFPPWLYCRPDCDRGSSNNAAKSKTLLMV